MTCFHPLDRLPGEDEVERIQYQNLKIYLYGRMLREDHGWGDASFPLGKLGLLRKKSVLRTRQVRN